ncbi:L-seryl-tRNA(Sec) selenium transferase [Fusibacter bizertensis]|uniref:L-seryl-tRNA(Sec) selenium transferase n=1 Tax=Fusibacter bizertensis TaxID=1488331 RepID=A0ABT6ND81_9FIRM|nr:L-seryl-tRNA(Sec) selenium transferase [Fusibacter bizertensis]MDH8678379.1 L-seryl-tRNA(Sec) selenium transferase [Fusibacter bizertensis]
MNEILRQIPKIDLIIELLPEKYLEQLDIQHIKTVIDENLNDLRTQIVKGKINEVVVNEVILNIVDSLERLLTHNIKHVINASGIVLHTNLGRAVLSKQTLSYLEETMSHYNTLEYDLIKGGRGSRYAHVEGLLCRLTNAEAALVVNNNAAAVILVLNTLANDKEVILSRGELVEIGGSFRIPDVMKASGCKLVEVGTTNKTHLYDYENAISSETGMILKVHTSNYQILGFTHSVDRESLGELSRKIEIPFYEDLGSGAIINFDTIEGLQEPCISECIRAGVDLISFSGDKLLGASQAGIIVGKKKYIDLLKKNQLLRALRIDKLSLAVLEDTLIKYQNKQNAILDIPTLSMLHMSEDAVYEKVTRFVKANQYALQKINMRYAIEPMVSQVGGGALPLVELPSYGLTLKGDLNLNNLQIAMRKLNVPIICKIDNESIHFDFRTIFDDEFSMLIDGITTVTLGAQLE